MGRVGGSFLNLKMLEEVVEEEFERFLATVDWLEKALKSEDRPFTKKITPFEEYQRLYNLGPEGWAAALRMYGIDEVKKMVRRAIRLRARFGELAGAPGLPDEIADVVGQEMLDEEPRPTPPQAETNAYNY